MIKESGRIQWDITWQGLAQYAKLAMSARKRLDAEREWRQGAKGH